MDDTPRFNALTMALAVGPDLVVSILALGAYALVSFLATLLVAVQL